MLLHNLSVNCVHLGISAILKKMVCIPSSHLWSSFALKVSIVQMVLRVQDNSLALLEHSVISLVFRRSHNASLVLVDITVVKEG